MNDLQQPPAMRRRTAPRPLWLGLAALLLALFFAPAGLILGVVAIVFALRAARRVEGRPERGTIAGAVCGLLAVAMSAATLVFAALLWPELNGLEECLQPAITHTDQQECTDVWLPKMEKRMNLPQGTFTDHADWFQTSF